MAVKSSIAAEEQDEKHLLLNKSASKQFLKSMRLLSSAEFRKVGKEGSRLVGRFLCIDTRKANLPRLGISTPAKYGTAPQRNFFKRVIREAFRLQYAQLPPLEMNVIPRQSAKKAKGHEIIQEWRFLIQNA